MLISTDSMIDSGGLCPGASERENQKCKQQHQLFVFWRALWVIGLSVSVCQRARASRWRPWSWLQAGAIRRRLNSLWQARVRWAPRRLLLQRGRDQRCHRCLDCVWQEQLYRGTDKTHINQWKLGTSIAALVGCGCQDACCFVVVWNLIWLLLAGGFKR